MFGWVVPPLLTLGALLFLELSEGLIEGPPPTWFTAVLEEEPRWNLYCEKSYYSISNWKRHSKCEDAALSEAVLILRFYTFPLFPHC